uniref:Uncharacterized protein n=1 Tax=Arundo donax TaxID=35708 RepID=A0A0A9BYC3_ARUDO
MTNAFSSLKYPFPQFVSQNSITTPFPENQNQTYYRTLLSQISILLVLVI